LVGVSGFQFEGAEAAGIAITVVSSPCLPVAPRVATRVAINIEWFMVVSFEVKDRGADRGTSTTRRLARPVDRARHGWRV